MKNIIPLLILTFMLASCQSEEEKLKIKLEPIVRNAVLKDSLAIKLDSLIIFKVDTLTEVDYAKEQIEIMKSKIWYHLHMSSTFNERAEMNHTIAKAKQAKAKMYLNVLNSRTLAEIEADDANKDLQEGLTFLKQSELHTDSSSYYEKRIALMIANRRAGKIDSTKLIGYIPRYRIIGANNNGVEVRKDSMYMFISPNFNILQVSIK
jgi:uncharacterized protein YcfL